MASRLDKVLDCANKLLEDASELQSQYWLKEHGRDDSRATWKARALEAERKLAELERMMAGHA